MKWALFLLGVALAGCSSTYPAKGIVSYAADADMVMAETVAMEAAPVEWLGMTSGTTVLSLEPVGTGGTGELTGRERLLVYSGSFSVAVGNIENSQEAARGMAESLGGYFQSLKADTITLRVPAARWEEAVAGVGRIGRVLDRQIDAADVTEEVIDLRLRLRNAKNLVKRFEELLARAENVEAALKVEKELGRVREEVERLEGRLAFLSDRIAYSTLVIRFVKAEDATARPQALPFPWLSELSIENLLGLRGGAR